jgi:S1-C subfamily serine protease
MTTLRRIHTRVFLLVVAGIVAAGVGAGLAFARGNVAAIGTGVVVIDTNLGYQNGAAAGTGMVLTSSGEILTNNHVIRGATTIKVVVPGTNRTYGATVVGYSVSEDVAVLELTGASNLKTVTTGNSNAVKIGQTVRALGNAGGTGRITTVTGTVTGLHKSITASDGDGTSEKLTNLIETNAPIQPGDSGGPLVDTAGRVIGMDTAASAGFTFRGTGASDAYAIPILTAKALVAQIVAGKHSATVHIGGTPFLGVQVSLAQSTSFGGGFGSPTTPTVAGALVEGLVDGGAAQAAGLQPGDVITSVAGVAVTAPTDLSTLLLQHAPGEQVAIGFTDQTGVSQSVTVTLGSGPPQ